MKYEKQVQTYRHNSFYAELSLRILPALSTENIPHRWSGIPLQRSGIPKLQAKSDRDFGAGMPYRPCASVFECHARVLYSIVYTKKATEDVPRLKSANLHEKVKSLIEIIKTNPYQNPPPYEKLVGNLKGAYSRRINIKHRVVYEVCEAEKVVKIINLWNHN